MQLEDEAFGLNNDEGDDGMPVDDASPPSPPELAPGEDVPMVEALSSFAISVDVSLSTFVQEPDMESSELCCEDRKERTAAGWSSSSFTQAYTVKG